MTRAIEQQCSPAVAVSSRRLIFVAGVMGRVGTNYLGRLLLAHPEVDRPAGHWELPLLDVADGFTELHSRFVGRRSPGRVPFSSDDFARCFGDGLERLLATRLLDPKENGRFLLHKNPSTLGIDRFRAFFPDAKLILLVRDGRDNVNSLLRAAGFRDARWWSPRRLAYLCQYSRKWASSARRIRAYAASDADHLVVTFESLHERPAAVLREIAEYVGLPISDAWLAEANSMPVKGSGFYGAPAAVAGPSASNTNWNEVPKDGSFQPVGRWRRQWSRLDVALFNWIAGRELAELGYGKNRGN